MDANDVEKVENDSRAGLMNLNDKDLSTRLTEVSNMELRVVDLLQNIGKLIVSTEEASTVEQRRSVVLQGRTLAQEATQLRDDMVELIQHTPTVHYPTINNRLRERLLKDLE